MNTKDAIEICKGWFNYLDRQQEKTIKMQRLAAHARKGPEQAKEAQRELRQMDRQPKVYDGARLRPAVESLLERIEGLERAIEKGHKIIRAESHDPLGGLKHDYRDYFKALAALQTDTDERGQN